MYVLVYHRITDPAAFWRIRERPDLDRPIHLRLVHALPSRNHPVLCCLWESDSVETVRRYTERVYAHVSRHEYHEVDAGEALGLHASGYTVHVLVLRGPLTTSEAEAGPPGGGALAP